MSWVTMIPVKKIKTKQKKIVSMNVLFNKMEALRISTINNFIVWNL